MIDYQKLCQKYHVVKPSCGMGCPDHITSRAKVVNEKLIKRVTKRVAEKRIAIRRVRKRQRLLNGNLRN